jgi:hypothetical protein
MATRHSQGVRPDPEKLRREAVEPAPQRLAAPTMEPDWVAGGTPEPEMND